MAIMKEAKTLTFGDTQYVVVDAEAREKIAGLEHNIESGQFLNQRGTGILTITTSPSSYTAVTPDGGTPTYRILLSTVLTQASVDKVLVGDILMHGTDLYPVYYVDDSYVYTRSRTSLRGSDGDDGNNGERGTGILTVSTSPTEHSRQTGVVFEDGSYEYEYWYEMSISIIKSQAGVNKVLKGDILLCDNYLYPISYISSTTAEMNSRTFIKGSTGSKGADGRTPEKGVDYFTDSDKQEIAEQAAQLVEVPEGGGGLTVMQISTLNNMFKIAAYTEDAKAAYTAFKTAFGITEPEKPDEPEEPHTHSYTSVVTTAATCTTAGVRTYTCSCGDSYTEEILATGHNYVDGICTVCGAVDPNAESGVSNESVWTDGVAYTFELVNNEYVDDKTGSFTTYNSWHRTPYLNCDGASTLRVELTADNSGTNSTNNGYNAFYDENKNFIAAFSFSKMSTVGQHHDVNIPSNAKYFVVSHKGMVMTVPYIKLTPYA